MFGAKMYKNYEHMDMLVLGVRVIHTGGLLALHNARHPDKRVELNDVFVSVNGVGGDWDRMLSECEKDTVNAHRPNDASNFNTASALPAPAAARARRSRDTRRGRA